MLTRDDAAWVADAVERDRTEGALRAAQTLLHAIDQLDRLAAQYANTDDLGKHEADVIERYGRIAQELQDARERLAELLDDKTVLAELDAANPRPVIVGGLPEQNVCMAIARLAVSREDSLRLVGWHRFSKRQTLTVQECLQAVAQHQRLDQRMVETELHKEWQRVQDRRGPIRSVGAEPAAEDIPVEFQTRKMTMDEAVRLLIGSTHSNPSKYIRDQGIRKIGAPRSKLWTFDIRQFPKGVHDKLTAQQSNGV